MSDPIAELARRVEEDPFFLASALREYARSEGMDDRALAAVLGCPVETLPRLALCRRPRPEPPHFGEDVDRIARRFEVDAGVLADIVRHADALAALRRPASREAGLLMAARDRAGPHPPPLSRPGPEGTPRSGVVREASERFGVGGEASEGVDGGEEKRGLADRPADSEEAAKGEQAAEGTTRGEAAAEPDEGESSGSPGAGRR